MGLPDMYVVAPTDLVESLDARANGGAWDTYTLEGDADRVTVYWETNDDRDLGVATESASESYDVLPRGTESALERALGYTGGGSRHGVGHAVIVTVNGAPVANVADLNRQCSFDVRDEAQRRRGGFAMSDACRQPATTAVTTEDGNRLWRCDDHRGCR